MENFVFIPYLDQIPEWKECYYDLNKLKHMLNFIVECIHTKKKLSKKIQSFHSSRSLPISANQQSFPSSMNIVSNQVMSSIQQQLRKQIHEQITQILEKWTSVLIEESNRQATICFVFIQYKSFQIKDRFGELVRLEKVLKKCEDQSQKLRLLYSNLFIECFYLQKAITYNISQQTMFANMLIEKIKEHKQIVELVHPNFRMKRFQSKNSDMLSQLTIKSKMANVFGQKTKKQVKKGEPKHQGVYNTNGIIIGFTIGTLILLILVIPFHNIVNNLSLDTNAELREQFPMWRGASYIIFYMWLLGLNILFFQSSQINYHLVFHVPGYQMPSSKQILRVAAFFSCIFLALLVVYVFQVSGEINSSFKYYSQIVWLIMLLYLFIPNPFKIKQKNIQFSMLMIKVFASCLPGQMWNFSILWMSEQFISFTQPSGDLFYTICFTASEDTEYCTKNSPNFSSAYIFFILLFRSLQCLRITYKNYLEKSPLTWDFMQLQWIGLGRAIFTTILNISAIFYRLKTFHGAMAFWIVSAIVNTLFAWFVDMRGDWGLLDFKNKTLLRDKLQFNTKSFYYTIMILDLFLRTAWTISLTPFVLNSTGINKLLFVMGISYLQILRRGMWNILKVGYQHIKNCKQFQVTVRDSDILSELKAKAQEVSNYRHVQRKNTLPIGAITARQMDLEKEKVEGKMQKELELEKVRRKRGLELLKEQLKERKIKKAEIDKLEKQFHHDLTKIKKMISKLINENYKKQVKQSH